MLVIGELGVVRTPRRRFSAGAIVAAGAGSVRTPDSGTTGGCSGAARSFTFALA